MTEVVFDRRSVLGVVRRVVVKVGSSTLAATGALDALVDAVAGLHRGNGEPPLEVAIVTSGAVACGMQRLGFAERPRELARIQALAAIGQADLMARYQASFARHGRVAAQILLTHQGLARRDDFLNVRHALRELLELGVVPIANENDTVATEELRFGDNDRLAAAFATVIDADLVILLSDIPHLFAEDPRQNPAAEPVMEVPLIDESIHMMAGAAGSAVGTGGMASKILAATIAVEAGIPLVIAHGRDPRIIHQIVAGEVVGTLFHPRKKLDRRRHWIGFLSRLSGSILIDQGAVNALRGGRSSLLPIGVTGSDGYFARGDGVAIKGPDGQVVARGLAGYDRDEVEQIRGLRSEAVAERLGKAPADPIEPVVHRNDLVLES